jgi:CheY-like chemotaxis protein
MTFVRELRVCCGGAEATLTAREKVSSPVAPFKSRSSSVQASEIMPIVDEKPRPAFGRTELRGAIPSAGGLSILLAEDSPDNRFLLEIYLGRSGHRLTFAENGREAFDLFQKRQFDLVLMDVQMPVMDGLTATRLIRDWELLERRAATPILACTAHGRASEEKASLEAGCNKHLSKPLSKEDLLSAIAEYGPAPFSEEERPGSLFVNIPEGLEEHRPVYFAGLEKDLRRLWVLFGNAEFTAMEPICHNLKGTGTSYGFPEVTYLGEIMESAAQNADTARLGTGLQELSRYLESVRLNSATY